MKVTSKELAGSIATSMRPKMAVFQWLIFALYILLTKHFTLDTILLALVYFLAIYGIVTIQNDIADKKIDIANHRNIPLAKGMVTEKQLIITALLLLIILAISSIYLGIPAVIIALLYLSLGYIYSNEPLALKNHGWFGIIILSICYGVMPFILAYAVTDGYAVSSYQSIVLGSFIIGIATLPLKDFKDFKGDKKYKKNTILVLHGSNYVKQMLVLGSAVAYLIIVYSQLSSNKMLALAILLVGSAIVYATSSKLDINNMPQRRRLGTLHRVIFYTITFIIVYIESQPQLV